MEPSTTALKSQRIQLLQTCFSNSNNFSMYIWIKKKPNRFLQRFWMQIIFLDLSWSYLKDIWDLLYILVTWGLVNQCLLTTQSFILLKKRSKQNNKYSIHIDELIFDSININPIQLVKSLSGNWLNFSKPIDTNIS